jgi:cell division protein FtsW (lipid II flippase)
MGVTYRLASERATVRELRAVRQFTLVDGGFLALSVVTVVIVLLTAAGRLLVLSQGEAGARAAADLNRVADAQGLEPALAAAFASGPERRLVARELFGFLVLEDGARRVLPNVGNLARARVSAATIDGAPAAAGLRQRLAAERARADAAGLGSPESMPLLTAAELAAIKPFLVVRSRGAFVQSLLVWVGLYALAFQLASVFWRLRGIDGDRVLLGTAHVLTAIGLAAMISRPDPLRDSLLFARYAQGVFVGVALVAVAASVRLRSTPLPQLTFLPLAGAVALSIVLILFGHGPTGSGAKVNLGPVQPIEAIRLLLALFLAGYFARRWELLRMVRSESVRGLPLASRLDLPRASYVVPLLAGVAAALTLFFFQRDLGPALMLAVVFLAAYAIARGTAGLALAGAVLVAVGFYVGYQFNISATLADRVRMWQSPWDNVARGGDQVAQALWALSAGGLTGTGLGLGDTRHLPAGHTDLVLAAVAEELGFAGLAIVGLLYATLVWRALSTARRASSDYDFFLAVILALSMVVPVFLMSAGLLGLVPLTGVVTPFLSFGGSAMAANFVALGLLSGIRASGGSPSDLEVFRRPLQGLVAAMAVAAAVIATALIRVQVVEADEILVSAHLGLQADGARRFQYNPRVLEAARQVPRGSILDRRGVPLATDDQARVQKASREYAQAGIDVPQTCGVGATRCYPFGGRAFHLLGDAETRVNWSATNTAFAERDAESQLRGFDDHATTIKLADGTGGEAFAIRRDYRELIPLVRYRHQPRAAAVAAFMSRPRDVTLSLDARLQAAVAETLSKYASRSVTGRAAAVVLDPDTGDVLATASYPWPSPGPQGTPSTPDELLDRARFGLYPPGSTFKLLTAAAALRRDPMAYRTRFTCSRLPDGRVGATIPGWSRPIRDDVLDRQPHGTVDMHRALAVSCNAYFAQLALSLGPGPLIDTAALADLSLARRNDPKRVRATLPQVGYGQADVLATPMQMARLGAAIAADGVLREPRLELSKPADPGTRLLTSDAARTLAGFMSDVVREGSGRSLRNHAVAIAGKTGTAEVGEKRSHSWFVGFAPDGRAKRRVAVAVIVEHAGYGGAAAAPAAGEIINAAAAYGLIQ